MSRKRTSKQTRKSRGSTQERWLDPEQRREILAYALIALAVLAGLALVPVSWLGERGTEWFPSGNVIGAVGRGTARILAGAFGFAAAFVPVVLLAVGLERGEWLSPRRAFRTVALAIGLLVLLPIGWQVVAPLGTAGGRWGAWAAEPLSTAFGWVGALILCGVALLVLIVATLRVSPVRPLGRALVQGGEVLGRTAVRARESFRVAPSADEAREVDWDEATRGDPDDVVVAAPDDEEDVEAGEDVADDEEVDEDDVEEEEPVVAAPTRARPERAKRKPRDTVAAVAPETEEEAPGPRTLPPLDLLYAPPEEERQGMQEELDRLGEVLVEKLRTFNVECTLGGRTTGPVVTQFEVVPAPGVKVNRIANLDADLALAMKAKSIRIVAPIPGKGAVGVEIPNPEPLSVPLREVLEARAFQAGRGSLPLALGRDLNGQPYVADLAKMPHVLIAGATGSGKSVCLNTIITSLVYRHTPETLRLLMIDPKMVELSTYGDLPHLRHSVVTDPKDAAAVLKWAVLEMERRYALLSVNGVRSLAEFNKRLRSGGVVRRSEPDGPDGDPDRWLYTDGVLPFIVVVVDELADLMMSVQSEVEKPLTQLAQKARAIGIHLIVATQRPSVNVITGLIKANFPTRIAFRVASKTDSRTILDQNGADALLGNGDMLFLPPGQSEPVRMQGAFISTEETDALMAWYRAERDAKRARLAGAPDVEEPESDDAEEDILELVRAREAEDGDQFDLDPDGALAYDELFRPAAEVCIQHKQGSTSLLQRKLRIGYGRAARIVDQLHEAGVLGPPDGSKPREVLIGHDGLDLLMSGLDERGR